MERRSTIALFLIMVLLFVSGCKSSGDKKALQSPALAAAAIAGDLKANNEKSFVNQEKLLKFALSKSTKSEAEKQTILKKFYESRTKKRRQLEALQKFSNLVVKWSHE